MSNMKLLKIVSIIEVAKQWVLNYLHKPYHTHHKKTGTGIDYKKDVVHHFSTNNGKRLAIIILIFRLLKWTV